MNGSARSGNGNMEKGTRDHAFTLLLNISDAPKFSERNKLKSDYADFVNELKAKKQKWNNDQKTLRHIFYKTHKEYLKNYEPYQSFEEVFSSGTYGCLTGTALYAFLLDELEYNYEIIETNYHMFLLVNIEGVQYLMESTDPTHGFVHRRKDIENRVDGAVGLNKDVSRSYSFNYDIHKSVSQIELVGLQYFNMAMDSYNNGNIEKTLYCLNEAARIDPSKRISEFLTLLMKSTDDQQALQYAVLHFDELASLTISN